jgi:hypothetical protein
MQAFVNVPTQSLEDFPDDFLVREETYRAGFLPYPFKIINQDAGYIRPELKNLLNNTSHFFGVPSRREKATEKAHHPILSSTISVT